MDGWHISTDSKATRTMPKSIWLDDSALLLSYLLHYNLRDTASEVVKWVKSPKFTSLSFHTHMMEESINS